MEKRGALCIRNITVDFIIKKWNITHIYSIYLSLPTDWNANDDGIASLDYFISHFLLILMDHELEPFVTIFSTDFVFFSLWYIHLCRLNSFIAV